MRPLKIAYLSFLTILIFAEINGREIAFGKHAHAAGMRISTKCNVCNGTGNVTCSQCNGSKKTYEIKKAPPKDGYIVVPEEIAVTCSKCYGSGKEKCYICHGSGYVSSIEDNTEKPIESPKPKLTEQPKKEIKTCTFCNGSGDCSVCKGVKKYTCPTCKGDGRVCPNLNPYSMNKVSAFSCQDGEKVTCPKCSGRGKVLCGTCNSSGNCTHCSGMGYTEKFSLTPSKSTKKLGPLGEPPTNTTCKSCNGSGTCKVCQGVKKISCTYCKGEGKACPTTNAGGIEFNSLWCRDVEKVTCPKCSGRGKVMCGTCNSSGKCTTCKGTGEVQKF